MQTDTDDLPNAGEPTETSQGSFNPIPPEILSQILSYVPSLDLRKNVLRVNKHFNSAANTALTQICRLEALNSKELCDAACQNEETALLVFKNKQLYEKLGFHYFKMPHSHRDRCVMWSSSQPENGEYFRKILDQNFPNARKYFLGHPDLTKRIPSTALEKYQAMVDATNQATATSLPAPGQ